MQEIQQIELLPHFLQQYDYFHEFDILHSIIIYVRNFHTQLLLGDKTSEPCEHWTNFKKYVTTQTKHNTLASWDELCDAFLATLSGRAYHWFQTIKHTIKIAMIYKLPF